MYNLIILDHLVIEANNNQENNLEIIINNNNNNNKLVYKMEEHQLLDHKDKLIQCKMLL
jgi:hypothetical protein